ncbi:hypothetical protein ABPG72_001571 [Tetrahymena utriculariae]
MLSANQSFEKNPQMGNDDTHQQFATDGLKHKPVTQSSLVNIPESLADLDQPQQPANAPSTVFLDGNEKKSLTKKQKYFIGLAIFLAVAMIGGGLAAYFIISQQTSGPKVPSTYPQYQNQIKVGQENNLVEIIHVPQSQKIYEYVLSNNQITAQSADKQSQTKSNISHKFGLVCLNVTDSSFDMLLYFIESKFVGNSETEQSTLKGYPSVKETQRRFLNSEEQPTQNEKQEDLENEYGFLNQKEIDILKSQGISAEQFYASSLPIIRFTMLKNGAISYVQQPLKIRYDIHQIYLNILEQISPIVLKDFYHISHGKRLLSSSSLKNKERILNNEIVEPVYDAKIQDKGVVSASKQYQVSNERNDNKTRTHADYSQTSSIMNGALSSSHVSSKFSLEDELVDQNDNSQPLFSKLSMNSNCIINFISQEDVMDQSFLQTLIQDQENMSVLEMTWDQAIANYNEVFNQTKQASNLVNKESNNFRVLQQAKSFSSSIAKPIFRKTYATMEFGADLKSECSDTTTSGDICNVGLYSYFNGDSMKILEKSTSVNISKVLKIYQYITNILNDKIFVVSDQIQKNIDAVSLALDDILNKVDYTISVDQNPVLSQYKQIIQGDSLNIIGQIKQIEQLIQTTLNSVNQLLQDPLNTLTSRIFAYLEAKNPALKQQIMDIKNFYNEKYAKIKNFVDQAKKNGSVSQAIKDEVKFLLDHHTQIIADVIEKPATEAMNSIEQSILENADKIFQNSTLIDQFINQNINSLVQNITSNANLTNLNLPLNNVAGFNVSDQLSAILSQLNGNGLIKQAISDVVKSVANNTQLINQLKDGLKQTLDTTKNTIIGQLESLKINANTSAEDQYKIDNIKAELSSIISFGSEIYQDVMMVKKNITDLTEQIKNIKASDVKRISIDLTVNLLNLPVSMAVQIKDDALKTAEQLKNIGMKIYTDLMSWKNDLLNDSKVLLSQAKIVYQDVISFLNISSFPEDDPKSYQKPLYNDIEDSISGVRNLMNTKFNNITNKVQQIQNIPNKFKQFVVDLKTLYQNTLSFANEIKLTIVNNSIDTGLIGQYITKFIQGTKQQSELVVLNAVESQVNQPIALQASSALTAQATQLLSNDLLQTYSQVISGQEVDVKKIYKQLITQLIAAADFQQSFQFPNINIPVQYLFTYPTPIGIAIQLKLSASWNTGIQMSFVFKNSTLDLVSKVNTKVVVTGEISTTVLIASAGGYAQGTFLDSNITAGVQLQMLNNYHGSYYFDGSFSPFDVKVGIYYQYYMPKELQSCGEVIEPLNQSDSVKKSVQSVDVATQNPTWKQLVSNKINQALKCLQGLKIQPVRKDLFDPLELKGDTYSKRIAEGTF